MTITCTYAPAGWEHIGISCCSGDTGFPPELRNWPQIAGHLVNCKDFEKFLYITGYQESKEFLHCIDQDGLSLEHNLDPCDPPCKDTPLESKKGII